MRWLDLLSQFDITICHVPGKSNVTTDALLHCPEFAASFGSVEYSLLTWICKA